MHGYALLGLWPMLIGRRRTSKGLFGVMNCEPGHVSYEVRVIAGVRALLL
jgi:hypothetical protein